MSSESPYGDSYEWPKDLFEEMHDMGIASFFVYTFSYIVDAARKSKEDGKGFTGSILVDEESNDNYDSVPPPKNVLTSRHLHRAFTPAEIKTLVADNLEELGKYYSEFKSQKRVDKLFRTLDGFSALAFVEGERAITLEEFDDEFQQQELVYGIMKDDVNKRIVLIFRGTENKLAFWSNWLTNAFIFKTKPKIPEMLEGKFDGVRIHKGFYNYIFNETVNDNDGEGKTKFNQILDDIIPLLKAHPDHKLYVTGHSLGGALSTLASFYLASSTDPAIPKPVSCINFAAPRVGNNEYFAATQYLEKTKQLRMLRGVNKNDTITAIPTVGYRHVGFQVTLYDESCGEVKEPIIQYPKPDMPFSTWSHMAWNNSALGNFNLGYDHGDYRERVNDVKEFLETKNLNQMYADPEIVGYTLD